MKLIFISYVALLLLIGVTLLVLGVPESIVASSTFILLIVGSVLSLLFRPRKAQN
ncbi:hypothetical protein JOC54_004440 [Alkalihalobacillus xiaoxiensis]|uniref:DUF1328 domain-containing protein n=1 Tax=Shouchella xiaoxiensis TaxID=766895 RepID=A0ABS2T299_9BACI|nr:hypothetical protein [Shouchella xiaoxiensis]MBM7841140.1 hypothetical protein [Shouchella xiaoxiensis]